MLPDRPMLKALAANWWLILLRGICAILFGLLTFLWPGVTLVTLVLFYGAYALVDGVFSLWAGLVGGQRDMRWWQVIVGVLGIGAGLATLFWPGLTALILLMFIAFWAIVGGIVQIVGAIRLRKEIDNEWTLILAGVVAVLFGIVLIAQPAAGALGLVTVIGAFALVYGVMLVAFAFRLRRHAA